MAIPKGRKYMLAQAYAPKFLEAERVHVLKLNTLKAFKPVLMTRDQAKALRETTLRSIWVYSSAVNTYVDRGLKTILPNGHIAKARICTDGSRLPSDEIDTFAATPPLGVLRAIYALCAHEEQANGQEIAVSQFDVQGAYYITPRRSVWHMLPPPDYAERHLKIDYPDLYRKYKNTNPDTHVLRWEWLSAAPGCPESAFAWSQHRDAKLAEVGFKRLEKDPATYVYRRGKACVMLTMHADDGIIAGFPRSVVRAKAKEIQKHLTITINDEVSRHLGINVSRTKEGHAAFHQPDLIRKLLAMPCFQNLSLRKATHPAPTGSNFTIDDIVEPVPGSRDRVQLDLFPYQEVIGIMAYLARGSRPDLTAFVSIMQSFQANYSLRHIVHLEHAARYLRDTIDTAMVCAPDGPEFLYAATDATYGTCPKTCKSQTGFCIFLRGILIEWRSFKQKSLAQSSMESEVIAANEATKAIMGVRIILEELGFGHYLKQSTPLLLDNQAAGHYMTHGNLSDKSKHIPIRYNYVKHLVQEGTVSLVDTRSELNIADLFTKVVKGSDYNKFTNQILGSEPKTEINALLKEHRSLQQRQLSRRESV